MGEPEIYSRSELAGLRVDAREGRTLRCPRCDRDLVSRPVPPRSEVGYVRSRIWWMCPECRRSAVIDARSVRERPPGD